MAIASEVGESILIEGRMWAGTSSILCLPIFTITTNAASSDALVVVYSPGWQWVTEPLPVRCSHPSIVSTTGLVTLLMQEGLLEGTPALGFYGTFERDCAAEPGLGNARQRLRFEGDSANLSGAYGSRDERAIHNLGHERGGSDADGDQDTVDGVRFLMSGMAAGTHSYTMAVATLPPPPPPAAPSERRFGLVIRQSFHVEFDPSPVTPLGRCDFPECALALQRIPGLAVTIEGLMESIGAALYNLSFREQRAEVMKGYLVRQH